jgi:hypothetical protein
MVSTNLDPTRVHAIDAAKRDTAPLMKPAMERKAIVIKTRRSGSSERLEKETAKEKAKAKGKEKEKLMVAESGRAMAKSYLALTTTKETATANGATTVASPTQDRREGSENKLPWPSRAL